MITVMVFGVSGVGKTHLINLALARLPNSCAIRASELIGLARENADPEYLRTLGQDEMHNSQELLVRGYHDRVQRLSAEVILLDAHSVVDQDLGFYDVPVEVIARLNPSCMVHVEDDVTQIMLRRQSDAHRTRPLRSDSQLAAYQARSRSACVAYSKALGVPLLLAQSGDVEKLLYIVEEKALTVGVVRPPSTGRF
jgi:adenylate kinase